jgi:23S rRNA pseudouridine2605 synthase
MATERIQKILAAAGFGARRTCEQLVLDGRVRINGEVVRTLPILVEPNRDRLTVDGRPVRAERHVYFILHKPRHVYCTHNDPSGRKRAIDLLVGVRERVYPVGRLEAEATGLLLMTNDGELAARLTHPRYGIPKTYRAEVDGCPSPRTIETLRRGVWLSDGRTPPAEVTLVHKERDKAVLEITLREARNREVQRLLAKLGHRVRRLVRIRTGKLSIRGLPVGAFRPLSRAEVEYLYGLTEHCGPDAGAAPRRT